MLSYIAYLATILSLSEAISCPGSAKYTLTFQAEWTEQTHPEDFPSGKNPHFSRLVGCSHNAGYLMWKPDINATQGVKDVAEHATHECGEKNWGEVVLIGTNLVPRACEPCQICLMMHPVDAPWYEVEQSTSGTTHALNNEMDRAIKENKALRRFQGSGITNTGTSIVEYIEVNTTYPLVSAITMIAPSPDWFVGVHDYKLCNEANGKWFGKKVKDLFLYDSGTDDAATFVHHNKPSKPAVPIFLITNQHEGSLKSNNTIKRFGTFTFETKSNGANVFVYSYVNTALLNMIIFAVFLIHFY